MARRRNAARRDRELTDEECEWLLDPLSGRVPDGRYSPFPSREAEREAKRERVDELVSWCRRNGWRIPQWLRKKTTGTDG